MDYLSGTGEGMTPEQIAAAAARRNAAWQRTLNAQRTTTTTGEGTPTTPTTGEGMTPEQLQASADRRNQALMRALQARQTATNLSAQPAQQDPNKAYDLQRAQISADEAEARRAASTQLQEQAVGAGFEEGSGVMEKMNQKQDIAMRQAEGRRLGGVDVAQAEAAASSAEAEKGRSFVATQADLDRELTKEIEGGRLSLEEKKMAEQTRQFGSQQEFTREMTNQGYEQDAIVRAWNAGEAATNRAWSSSEAATGRAFTTSEREGAQTFQGGMAQFAKTAAMQMATLNNTFSTDAAIRARAWQEQDLITKATSDNYYNMGASGQAMDPAELENLKNTDILAYSSYMAGKSGMALADYQQKRDSAVQQRDAKIAALNPDDPKLQQYINDIFSTFNSGGQYGTIGSYNPYAVPALPTVPTMPTVPNFMGGQLF